MTTPRFFLNDPFTVLGVAVRTDGAGAASAIPELWARVRHERLLDSLPGRVGDDLFAVYTHLEDAGRSRDGWFSFLIGVRVDAAISIPDGMTLVTVPSSARAAFDVPDADPARVMEAWTEAWAFDDGRKTFLCEYEHYGSGVASVVLGVRAVTA